MGVIHWVMVTTRSQEHGLPGKDQAHHTADNVNDVEADSKPKHRSSERVKRHRTKVAVKPTVLNGIQVNGSTEDRSHHQEVQVVVEQIDRSHNMMSDEPKDIAEQTHGILGSKSNRPSRKKVEERSKKALKARALPSDGNKDTLGGEISGQNPISALTKGPEAVQSFTILRKDKPSNVSSSSSNINYNTTKADTGAKEQDGRAQSKVRMNQKELANGAILGKEQHTQGAKPKHRRFDDGEDVGLSALQSLPSALPTGAESTDAEFKNVAAAGSEESEDGDAPEEVTAAAGEERAKAATANAAKAIKRCEILRHLKILLTENTRQAEEKKSKRRKRDQDLKEQAEATKKRKAAQRDASEDVNDDSGPQKKVETAFETANELARSLLESGRPLPAKLPDEIFAFDPQPRPSPSAAIAQQKSTQEDAAHETKMRRKRLEAESKPIKDVKYGGTSVRVLPQLNPALPPAAVQSSARVKEQWLKGRRKVEVPGYRHQGARSFLRK